MGLTTENVSPLQVYATRDFTGLTETTHLSNAYLTEPEKIGSIMAYAYGVQDNNVLTLLTGGIGNSITVNNREYEWDLHSQNAKLVVCVEDSPTTGAIGIKGSEFTVILEEDWFEVDDNLVTDNGTQIHIVRKETPIGFGYPIVCTLNDPDYEAFLSDDQVNEGAVFTKDYTTVSEYSHKGGGVHYATPYKLRNQLTTLRKTYNVTRNAAKAAMVIEIPDAVDGTKKTRLWTKLAEWTALAEWYREVDKSMLYSIYNKNSRGEVSTKSESGRPIYHGAGLRQQIAPANIQFYTKLTYSLLDNFLLKLSSNATKWGGDTKFVALTGKMGMREFDDAIKSHAAGNNIQVTDHGTFITGSGDSLGFTGYFKTVSFLNGLELTVKEFPPYDDTERHRTLHPETGFPLESYRFTILNFGQKEGKSNIQKVVAEGTEMAMWHVCGSTTPVGDVASSISTMRASGIDGYDVHIMTECGIRLSDPTSCGELIMAMQ